MAKTAAERKQEERDRKTSVGFVRREIWVHPEDFPQVQKTVEKLADNRKKKKKKP